MSASRDRLPLGILLMVGFSLLAPAMDACAKLIGDALAVGQIVAARFGVQFALLLPLALVFGWLAFRSRVTGVDVIERGNSAATPTTGVPASIIPDSATQATRVPSKSHCPTGRKAVTATPSRPT